MHARRKKSDTSASTGANIGCKHQLWQMADALRGNLDAAKYKHVVLGPIFLKFNSDPFEEQHAKLVAEQALGADPDNPDEYRAQSIFWTPPKARWPHLKTRARQRPIDQIVDDASAGIERDNSALKADFILANPPFRISHWGGERIKDEKRWQFATPPTDDVDFASVQHIVHRLAPTGVAGFAFANGAMSSNQSGEGEIRTKLFEAAIVRIDQQPILAAGQHSDAAT